MISGAGLCWQHVGGVGSTTTTTWQKCRKNWKGALESKDLKVNLMKSNVMLSKIVQVTLKPSSNKASCGICGGNTMLKEELCNSCVN